MVDMLRNYKDQNQSGQALIEYLLILIVTVAIILGLAAQIFTPLQKFLEAMMGTYVECLLETGELPSLGTAEPSIAAEECSAKLAIAKQQLKEGASKNGEGAGESLSGSQGSPSAKQGKGDDQGAASGSVARGSAGGGGSIALGANRKRSRGQESPTSSTEKVDEDSNLSLSDSKGLSLGGGQRVIRINRKRRQVLSLSQFSEQEVRELKRRVPAQRKRVLSSESVSAPLKRLPVRPPDSHRKSNTAADDGFNLGLGNFLRYLLIATILIALLVFVGRQAFQMSKSFNE